jgi:glycosyltransferase involved in cell wall biosynthesis
VKDHLGCVSNEVAIVSAQTLAEVRPTTSRRVSVVIPCLNEAGNIRQCVQAAHQVLRDNGIDGEVIVADNGSEDGSADLARAAGAAVVEEPRRGYGSAYLAGFSAAHGDYIVMVDADLTYDFEEIPHFVSELDRGGELVMGNRMQNVQPGAMSWVSRVGNPILSGFLNLLYRTPVGDAHCGMRALRRDVLPVLDLQSTGMEFASEMVIRAARAKLDIREVPIALHPRGGESKLHPFRDGWRHLKLMLVYNPTALFFVPGAALVLLGSVLMAMVFAHVRIAGRELLVHTLIGGSLLVVAGSQLIGFGLCARAYGVYQLGDHDRFIEGMHARLRLEQGLLVGTALFTAGLAMGGVIVGTWISHGLGKLGEERLAILSATLVIVGIQVVFTSFLLSIIGLRRRD